MTCSRRCAAAMAKPIPTRATHSARVSASLRPAHVSPEPSRTLQTAVTDTGRFRPSACNDRCPVARGPRCTSPVDSRADHWSLPRRSPCRTCHRGWPWSHNSCRGTRSTSDTRRIPCPSWHPSCPHSSCPHSSCPHYRHSSHPRSRRRSRSRPPEQQRCPRYRRRRPRRCWASHSNRKQRHSGPCTRRGSTG